MLKILSYNVKGLNAPVKRHSLAADVLRLKPDVVCLQETHFKRLAHPPLGIRNFSTQYHATGPTKARGVSILIRSDVVYQLHRKISDPQGRYLILVCSLNHKTYTLVNVYSPNTEQLSFISGVLHRVSLVATGVLLICGDLNYSIDPSRDVRSPKIPIPTKRSIRQGQKLRDLFSSHGLYDVWRLWHPGDSEFTFHSRVHNTYSRLDYFLLQTFDRVDWMFLRKVLLKFGFPVSVLQSIFALYASPTASVLTAGFLSTQFGIRNGTRQGCPLSPLLYALVIEPLAQRIRQDDGVAGIMVGPTVYKIGLFADDILLTLAEPTDSLPRLSELLTEYSAVSFHKINLPKSQALTINVPGNVRESLKQHFQFEWREDYLQYLGVKMSKSPDQLFDLNYKPFLSHIKQLLFKWKRTSLSWMGRMAAIKMSLLPKLLYYFRTIPIRLPKSYLDEVQSLLNHYVWNGKRPRLCLIYISTTELRCWRL
uniref:Reverse transcriptase domain-containing protein n=1 Tax=Leptobrachium leishanense TaxID=445787 RepID=A0A8C5LUV5_9ANUR